MNEGAELRHKYADTFEALLSWTRPSCCSRSWGGTPGSLLVQLCVLELAVLDHVPDIKLQSSEAPVGQLQNLQNFQQNWPHDQELSSTKTSW